MKSICVYTFAAAFALLAIVPTIATAQMPNVLVIMTDDQGYGDLSCHGNPYIKTPNLDQLASDSLRLTDFHVAPMCTATRGQLLTGLDAFRNGAINVGNGRSLLRPELKTMADVFKAAGYRTAMFGKWHLGHHYPYRPQDRGFDHSVWFPSSHIGSSADFWNNDYFDDTYWVNGKPKAFEGYCTDVFFAEAIDWMTQSKNGSMTKPKTEQGETKSVLVANTPDRSDRSPVENGKDDQVKEDDQGDADQNSEQPFFAYLAPNAPHWPWFVPDADRIQVRDRALAELQQLEGLKDRPKRLKALIRFLAMCENIDRNVGQLDEALKSAGLFENTIVVFLSDNGSTFGHDYFPAGMKGKKTQLWEGGHRVPCFIRFPAEAFKPREIPTLTQVQDLLPTLAAMAGDRVLEQLPKELDGDSLLPLIKMEPQELDERKLVINYSRMPGYPTNYTDGDSTIPHRDGALVMWKRWRLVENQELYDLDRDPMQRNDIAQQHPEVVKKMRSHLETWWEGVKDGVQDRQRIVVGHEEEPTSQLSAFDWLEDAVDQQRQVRLGVENSGAWALDIHQRGLYRFELRRWPKESGLKMSDAAEPIEVNQGRLPEGESLAIRSARIKITNGKAVLFQGSSKSGGDNESFVFLVDLPAGPVELKTWLDDAQGKTLCGAFYVEVTKSK